MGPVGILEKWPDTLPKTNIAPEKLPSQKGQ